MWVFLGHLLYGAVYQVGFESPEGWGWLGELLLLHFLAVDGFFILSGCLLTLNYWDYFTSQTSGWQIDRFYLLRLARLYPLHLLGIGLIGVFALCGVAHPISSGLEEVIFAHWEWSLILNLTGMHAWGIMPVAAWNEPAWTVSAMMFLYILFPNLVLILRRADTRLLLWGVPGLLLGYCAVRHSIDLGSNSDGAGALIRALVFFVLGICLARLQMAGVFDRWRCDMLLGISLVGFVLGAVLWWRVGGFDMLVFHALIALMVAMLLSARGVIAEYYSCRLTRWLGQISYALFMLHYPVLLALKALCGDALQALAARGGKETVLAYGFTIGVVLAASHLAYWGVERPAHRYFRRWMGEHDRLR